MSCNTYDLSSTQKTVRNATIEYFLNTLSGLIEKIKSDIETERLKITEKKILPHQMRKCFKIGSEGCPLNPDYQNNKIFIAMPFSDEYKDSYNYGIVPVLDDWDINTIKPITKLLTKILCVKYANKYSLVKWLSSIYLDLILMLC